MNHILLLGLTLAVAALFLTDSPDSPFPTTPVDYVYDGDTIRLGGDTIRLGGATVRLWGIDAPERHQECRMPYGRSWPCGEVSRLYLVELLRRQGNIVRCVERDRDRYGRIVALCGDINRNMVRLGQAVDYARYSGGAFAAEEAEARAAMRGIWAGTFDTPELWRREHQ